VGGRKGISSEEVAASVLCIIFEGQEMHRYYNFGPIGLTNKYEKNPVCRCKYRLLICIHFASKRNSLKLTGKTFCLGLMSLNSALS
jgi:hypothetical protein